MLYLLTDLIQAKLVINILQEKISDVESLLFIFMDQFLRGAADDDLTLFVVLFPVKFFYILFCPVIRILAGSAGLYLVKVAKFFDSNGSDLAVFTNSFLDIETNGVFRFCDSKFHGIVPP